jgi:hypothetical protein
MTATLTARATIPAMSQDDPVLRYFGEQTRRQERRVAALERFHDVMEFRGRFRSYTETFLQRRRELRSDTPPERVEEMRSEYRKLQRAVVQAYRPIRDLYRDFIEEEPGYDQRHEVVDDPYGLALDYPLTNWWTPLTFDEALDKWSNADDEHIGHFLRRQHAVLEAFEDWARIERPGPDEQKGARPPEREPAEVRTTDRPREVGERDVTRILNHPWVVTIVGGAIAAVIAAVILLWLT